MTSWLHGQIVKVEHGPVLFGKLPNELDGFLDAGRNIGAWTGIQKRNHLWAPFTLQKWSFLKGTEKGPKFFELLQLQPPCRGSCTSRISWGVLKASPKSCAVVSKDTKETPNLRYGRTWMDTLMPLKFRYWWYNLLAWMNQTCTCCMPCWQGVLSNSRDKVQGLFKGIRTTYGICTLTRNPSKEGSYVRPSTQDVL